MLNSVKILQQLSNQVETYQLHLFELIDSTNDYLLNLNSYEHDKIQICIAENQTAGRGRQSKKWQSFKDNIHCSISLNVNLSSIQKFNYISLIVGLAIRDTLSELFNIGDKLKLKWPNDLVCDNGKKLGGILVESKISSVTQKAKIIIGFGINIDFAVKELPQNWQSLSSLLPGHNIDRNIVIPTTIKKIVHYLNTWDVRQVLIAWPKYDWLSNKKISVLNNNNLIEGDYLGIDQNGSLILKTHFNKIMKFNSGDISIKQIN